jgi:hypothetical protein
VRLPWQDQGRAISEACKLGGTVIAGNETEAAVSRASLSSSASNTAFVISSANNGMPSVRSIMFCLTLSASGLLPVTPAIMAAISRSSSRFRVSAVT